MSSDPVSSPEMNWRRLHPKVRIVWWFGSMLTDLVLIAVVSVGALVLDANTSASLPDGWYAVPVAAVVAAGPLRALYVSAAYGAWRYRFDVDHLELRHGVFWRRTSSMPYHRLQQVDEGQGPLERWLGMATVKLRSAAATTDATIPGIAADDVDELRRLLMQRSGRDDGA